MSKRTKGWEIRYSGDFGRSLYGEYHTYEQAQRELALFRYRAALNGQRKIGESAEVQKSQ